MIVLGVDGGNTKTVALVVAADGTVAGAGRDGCGDIYGRGTPGAAESALGALDAAVGQALAAAGLDPSALAAAVFSMAGADWPEDFALLEAAVAARAYGRTTRVVNDAFGALRAGTPDGVGVGIACGTGVATGARSAAGRTWHSSHWHEPAGGAQLGREAVRAVMRAELGLDPPTALTPLLLAAFEVDSVEAVLRARTRRGIVSCWSDTAFLAPLVLDTAAAGDAAAERIVRAQGERLGEYATAAARRVGLGPEPFPLVLSGGTFRHPGGLLRDAVVARFGRDYPEARPVWGDLEPAAGAALLAFDLLGQPVSEATVRRLRDTMPEPRFFATSRGQRSVAESPSWPRARPS